MTIDDELLVTMLQNGIVTEETFDELSNGKGDDEDE